MDTFIFLKCLFRYRDGTLVALQIAMNILKCFFIFSLLLLSEFSKAATFVGCNKNEKVLLQENVIQSIFVAKSLNLRIDQEIRKRKLTMWSLSYMHIHSDISRLKRAQSFLKCSQRVINELEFHCRAELNNRASIRVFLGFGSHVDLNKEIPYDTSRNAVSTLVHESVHKCGATDSLYFHDGVIPSDSQLIPWEAIADTYSYWIENGFCLPGKSC